MLPVLSDVSYTADDQRVTLMGLLDLSVGPSTVSTTKRLQLNFGFVDTVLCWLTSFLLPAELSKSLYESQLSPSTSVVFDIPQGSVLGPPWALLFVLYTHKLSHVVTAHSLILHQYTLTQGTLACYYMLGFLG